MARVIRGRLIPVPNTERKFGSADHYQAVWVEDEDGSNECCLLFTDREIQVAKQRAEENKEDLTHKSWLTDATD